MYLLDSKRLPRLPHVPTLHSRFHVHDQSMCIITDLTRSRFLLVSSLCLHHPPPHPHLPPHLRHLHSGEWVQLDPISVLPCLYAAHSVTSSAQFETPSHPPNAPLYDGWFFQLWHLCLRLPANSDIGNSDPRHRHPPQHLLLARITQFDTPRCA